MLTAVIKQATNATRYSLGGLKYLLSSEFAARIELYTFMWIFPSLIYLGLDLPLLLGAIVLFLLLLAIEALNTAVEVIVDKVSPEISTMAKHAKDLGSFSVMSAIFANLGYLAYVLTKIDWVAAQPRIPLLASVILLVLALYCAVKARRNIPVALIMTVLAALFFLGTGVFIASDYFTGAGFDHKVLYHLNTGLGGAGFREYSGLITGMTAYILAAIAFAYIVFDILGRQKHRLSKKVSGFINRDIRIGAVQAETPSPAMQSTPKSKPKLSSIFALIFGLGALAAHPLTHDLRGLAESQALAEKPPSLSEFELYLQPTDIRLTNKKNIVVLYLEGLERTYFNEEVFPGLVPELAKIEKESIYFSDIRQVYNTEWTVAGLVGTQCGVPMYTPSQGNTMNSYDQFVPNALCLGDILKSNGYYLEFMGGSGLEFAGKGKFFETHGFDTIIGKEDHIKDPAKDEQYSGWGLYDDVLLEDGVRRFKELSKKRKPFGLVLLTLDTHPPRGHISPSCEGVTYQDGSNGMLNAVHCADKLAAKFLEDLKNSRYAKDTLIIVASDHVSMNHTASAQLREAKRRNVFFIVDPSIGSQHIAKQGSVLDIGPTVLSRLGMTATGLGFGRDLFSDEETLLDLVPPPVDVFLIRMGKLMKKELWSFPALSSGMIFDMEQKQLKINDRWLATPVVLTLDAQNEITQLDFDSLNLALSDTYLPSKLPVSQKFLWVDKCEKIQRNLGEKIQLTVTDATEWCAAMGAQAEAKLAVQALVDKSAVFPQVFAKE